MKELLHLEANGGIGWEGWENVGTRDIDTWLLGISARGWLMLDWFEKIVEGTGLEDLPWEWIYGDQYQAGEESYSHSVGEYESTDTNRKRKAINERQLNSRRDILEQE
jgi:hypothetical protein